MDPPGGAPGPTPGDDSPDGQGSTASTPDPFAFGRAPNSPERPARPSGGASTSTSSPTHGSASMTRSRQGPPGQTRAHPTPSGSASATFSTDAGVAYDLTFAASGGDWYTASTDQYFNVRPAENPWPWLLLKAGAILTCLNCSMAFARRS